MPLAQVLQHIHKPNTRLTICEVSSDRDHVVDVAGFGSMHQTGVEDKVWGHTEHCQHPATDAGDRYR